MLKIDFLKYFKNMSRNNILAGIAIIAIIITGVLIYANSNGGLKLPSLFGPSADDLGKKAVDYINNNGLSQTPASLVSTSEESGVVKVKIKIGTTEFDSYVTKDGKYLFPESFDMTPATDSNSEKSTTVQKSDNPMLEAYVVARCPYGLQMQRAMAEAVKEKPELANYMKVRYMGSISNGQIFSMHDVDTATNDPIPNGKEAMENLRQICIREEQPAKYWSYVGCQMKASGTEKSCEYSTGVDSAKLSACISDPSKGLAYAQEDFDLNTQYSITGSPTLVLNGTVIDGSGRSADGVKTDVCSGFNTEAGFCSANLETASAAASFSATYASSATSDSNASANCGS